MENTGVTLFETAIGRCAIAWRADHRIAALQLPEADAARTVSRLRRRLPDATEAAPPPAVKAVVERIVDLLDGGGDDLADVAVDLDAVPEFHRRVYAVARTIGPGSTISYGELARRLGDPQAARDVGQALGANPLAIIVPCHRVLAAAGGIGGFSANGGPATKRRMLAIERARVGDAPDLFADEPRPAASRVTR